MTDAEYVAIKNRAAKRLLAIPHVTAVGVGGREKNGRPTGEIVIKVFVTRKRPIADVPADELIPAAFEGVPTDVAEMGPLGRKAAVPGAKVPVPDKMDDAYVMPMQGGMTMIVDAHQDTSGTMGCLLRDKTDATAVYALTNYHVAAKDGKLSLSWRAQRRKAPLPSNLYEAFGTAEGGGEDSRRDAAIFRLDPGQQWLPSIKEIGFVKGTHTVTVAEAATQKYPVRKRGARTGLTGGVVTAINTSARTDGITRDDVMAIRPNPDPTSATQQMTFSERGDSGSVVVNNDNEVVALLYAGEYPELNPDTILLTDSATPIATVLERFKSVEGLDLDVAIPDPAADLTEAAQTQTVPPVAGAPLLPSQQQLARADGGYYRPLMAGSQMLPSPMQGLANGATLGCIVTDAASPGTAYALTCYDSLTANGTIPPTAATALGQPDNHSSISGCCSNTIAHFALGGPDKGVPTAAIVKLVNDQKWLPEILRIGVILANRIPPVVSGEQVRKHGAETRLTGGALLAVGGLFGTLPAGVRDDAMLIRPNPNPAQPNGDLCFSQRGDRGAVVVNDYNQIIGMLYDELDIPDAQGHHVVHGVATPIDTVLDALKQGAGITLALAGANVPGQVQTTSARQALPEEAPPIGDAISQAPPELARSPAGRWMTAAWHVHQAELRGLIAGNRKVAAIWHRSGGPALLQVITRALRSTSARIPGLVNGLPVALCIDRLAHAFSRYGSPRLGSDLALLRSRLPPMEGLAGHELLAILTAAFDGDAFAGPGLPALSEAVG